MRIPIARALLLLVPVVGVVEYGLHVWQVRDVVSDADWAGARELVQRTAKPEDLVTFAPRWIGPVAQMHFGDGIASLPRIAHADVTRFPRAIEVSVRGRHDDELSGWRTSQEERAGKVTVRVLENPSVLPVLVDLVTRVETRQVSVARDSTPCAPVDGAAQTGQLGYGTAIPGHRFQCAAGFLGASVLADLEYRPRRCIYAQPPGGGSTLHLAFPGVKMGTSLMGHHAISVHQERDKTGASVALTVRVGDKTLGRNVHADGEGWKSFEFDTRPLEGQTVEVLVDVSSAAGGRPYCFELTSR
ncbi:MAG: hypothetical protein U0169_20890 [Polyangiaceae bacterium]